MDSLELKTLAPNSGHPITIEEIEKLRKDQVLTALRNMSAPYFCD